MLVFEGYIGTGVYSHRYDLGDGVEFITFIGGKYIANEDNEWGGGLYKNDERLEALEASIESEELLRTSVQWLDIMGGRYMVFQEKNIEHILSVLADRL